MLTGIRGLDIAIQIRSNLSRKYRRTILLSLFRHMKTRIRELQIIMLSHENDPIATTLSMFLRGVVGNDGLDRNELKMKGREIGYWIRLYRTQYGFTQKQFAELMDISKSQISMIERGKRDLSLVAKIKLSAIMDQQQLPNENSLQTEPIVQSNQEPLLPS